MAIWVSTRASTVASFRYRFAIYFQILASLRDRFIFGLLGIELNGTVNEIGCTRNSLKWHHLSSSAESVPDLTNGPKTGQYG